MTFSGVFSYLARAFSRSNAGADWWWGWRGLCWRRGLCWLRGGAGLRRPWPPGGLGAGIRGRVGSGVRRGVVGVRRWVWRGWRGCWHCCKIDGHIADLNGRRDIQEAGCRAEMLFRYLSVILVQSRT